MGARMHAKAGASKEDIRREVAAHTGYDLSRTVADIRAAGYRFDVSCAGAVPEAIVGGIAEAFWGGLPAHIREPVEVSLDSQLLAVVRVFGARFPVDRRG